MENVPENYNLKQNISTNLFYLVFINKFLSYFKDYEFLFEMTTYHNT